MPTMMPYLGLDTETTGLDPEQDQLLQLAMVLDNDPEVAVDDLPHFNAVLWHERITGHPVALKMNADLIAFIAANPGDGQLLEEEYKGRYVTVFQSLKALLMGASHWLGDDLGKITVAGKNVAGFDLRFLGAPLTDCFHYRVLDVGSMAMGGVGAANRWNEPFLPSLSTIARGVTHDALDDARAVVRAVRSLRP